MNENTLQFLNELSIKLGTTSEYLWGVLIRQAPIDGWINLSVMAVWVAVGVFALIFFYKKINDESWDEEFTVALLGISILSFVIIIVVAGICFSDTVGAIVNPEYWAFQKILSSIKCK